MINLIRHSELPQFHCLPTAFGRLCHRALWYGFNIPGINKEVSHIFDDSSVDDAKQSMAVKKCKNLSILSVICVRGSFVGSQKTARLSNCVTAINMVIASVLSNGLSNISGRSK